MKNVKKLINMKFINVDDCTNDTKSTNLCENCIMSKIHRSFNKKSMKIDSNRRITLKNQRIYIDLIDEKKIIRTSRKKRYVIIFINDFIDYI